MGRPKKDSVGIADAAEFLYAIIDEFKAESVDAAAAMRVGKSALDAAVNQMFKAFEKNAIARLERQSRV